MVDLDDADRKLKAGQLTIAEGHDLISQARAAEGLRAEVAGLRLAVDMEIAQLKDGPNSQSWAFRYLDENHRADAAESQLALFREALENNVLHYNNATTEYECRYCGAEQLNDNNPAFVHKPTCILSSPAEGK